MSDVINTLNEREKNIVELLIKNDGKAKQAHIVRELLLPKTSVSRALEALEKKNIIALKPYGKTNIVELSEWFLQE
jgi:uncharacterized membrane protein